MYPIKLAKKIFPYFLSTIFLIAIFLIRNHWVTHKEQAIADTEEASPRIVVGNLGGIEVNIPSYYIELLEYDDSQGWSGRKNNSIPTRTHQSRIASFGAITRYPDMAGLSNPSMRADKNKYTAAETPWINLTILSGPMYPGNGWLERRSRHITNSPETDSTDTFKKESENLFGGLDLYVQQGTAIDGRPKREIERDIYIHQDKNRNVKAYISCSNAKYPAVLCEQSFSMEDDGHSIQVSIQYRRTMLMHWQDMQNKTRQLILSWQTPKTYSQH